MKGNFKFKNQPLTLTRFWRKKNTELELERVQNEMKKSKHLIDVVKKSKAEEIANLNNEVLRLKKKIKEIES